MSVKNKLLHVILLGMIVVAPGISNRLNFVSLAPGVNIPGESVVSARCPDKYGHAYYGIRYATATRFEHSVENTDYSYLKEARPRLGFVCPQHFFEEPGSTVPPRNLSMNEDCLYLDVFVPTLTKSSGLLPVMIFIYGGGLQLGDKDQYDGSFLAMETGAVYVVINYRVSIFGFLSTGDKGLPGNYGLGDCKTAVNWVVKHIHKFNGNADQITIFGESAGAMLVSAMYMDPQIRNLTRTVVALSGSVLTETVRSRNPKERVDELAQKVNCLHEYTAVMVQCLKEVSVPELLNASRRIERGNPEFCPYGFVVDGKHIADDPRLVISEQSHSPFGSTLITGYLREDFSLLLMNSNPEFFVNITSLTYAMVKKSVAEQFLPTHEKCATPRYDLAERVLRYYKIRETDGRNEMMLKFFRLSSDAVFGYPALKELFLYSSRRQTGEGHNQFYMISYDQNFKPTEQISLGAFHAMDISYIFGDAYNQLYLNITLDGRVQSRFLNMMRQIVHNGKMDGPLFGANGRYMELTEMKTWEERQSDLKSLVDFWDDVLATPCGSRIAVRTNNGSDMSITSAAWLCLWSLVIACLYVFRSGS